MLYNHRTGAIPLRWTTAWTISDYRLKFVIAAVSFALVLFSYPYFFAYIQNRNGFLINDRLLNAIPGTDVSGYIFFLIYGTIIVGIIRAARSPATFLLFLWSCLLLSLARLASIALVPLDPPVNLIPLRDPILSQFYGHSTITKDLFFSGHTANVFLVFLIVQKKWDKVITLIATILVGTLLLVQHIHYTLDVLTAPVFVYFIYVLAKKITGVTRS